MAKNKASVQSLFQEEFQKHAEPVPETPVKEVKPIRADADAPVKTAVPVEKRNKSQAAEEPEPAKTEPIHTFAEKKQPSVPRLQADEKKLCRPSSIYLSGENVNFVKYITHETRVSQKQYMYELLLEKQEKIERENPLTEQKKVIDFKQPVRGKYRSSKENSTIYSISVPKDLIDYFEKVCERDHITFSTLVDNLLSERREAFLREQGED